MNLMVSRLLHRLPVGMTSRAVCRSYDRRIGSQQRGRGGVRHNSTSESNPEGVRLSGSRNVTTYDHEGSGGHPLWTRWSRSSSSLSEWCVESRALSQRMR